MYAKLKELLRKINEYDTDKFYGEIYQADFEMEAIFNLGKQICIEIGEGRVSSVSSNRLARRRVLSGEMDVKNPGEITFIWDDMEKRRVIFDSTKDIRDRDKYGYLINKPFGYKLLINKNYDWNFIEVTKLFRWLDRSVNCIWDEIYSP